MNFCLRRNQCLYRIKWKGFTSLPRAAMLSQWDKITPEQEVINDSSGLAPVCVQFDWGESHFWKGYTRRLGYCLPRDRNQTAGHLGATTESL